MDIFGYGSVTREIRRHEDSIRTQALRTHRRHGRAHTESPSLIRSSADDRSVAFPGDNYGLPAQLGIIALLDGSVERIPFPLDDFSDSHSQPYYSRFQKAVNVT